MDISEKIIHCEEKKKSLGGILETKFPEIEDSLKTTILKYSDIFNVDFVKEKGHECYLNSEDSVHQFFGVCGLLAYRIENDELSEIHMYEVEGLFLKVAIDRRREAIKTNDELLLQEADEMEVLSQNVGLLANIYQELN